MCEYVCVCVGKGENGWPVMRSDDGGREWKMGDGRWWWMASDGDGGGSWMLVDGEEGWMLVDGE